VVGLSRQGYYKARRHRQRADVDEAAICELVEQERCLQPRIGGRKLLVLLRPMLAEMEIVIGRDRFFGVLRKQDLLVPRRHRRGPATTDSRHRFDRYPNLLKNVVLTDPHQAWVSDITYVRTEEGFLYASLISDAYSRYIVGVEGSNTLAADGCLRALTQAIRQLPEDANTLHHSDRGTQYCCEAYVERLLSQRIEISMTEENHAAENAQAERLNGILKQEYGLGETFRTKTQARAALKQAVWLFNTRRPHTSLGYQIPAHVHKPPVEVLEVAENKVVKENRVEISVNL
jgi:putative transposase